MNYLVKGITAFLTTSFIFRIITLLFKSKVIDLFTTATTAILLVLIGFSLYFIWHDNPSMSSNKINFIAFVGLFGLLLGIVF
jgi:hypothetical protein